MNLTAMNDSQIFTAAQDIMSHPALDGKSRESLPAYEELDTLHTAPRARKRYCALACLNCLLCCIPNCLWSCAASSFQPQPQPQPRQQQHFPGDRGGEESSWSCCCFGYRSSRERLYSPGVHPALAAPAPAVGGQRGQLHARPAQDYGGAANIARPVAVVPQRAQQYVRVIDSYRLEEKTEETVTTCAEHGGPGSQPGKEQSTHSMD